MTQKALEVVIRELQKITNDLIIKVSSLEGKIGEQNTLISNQSQLIINLTMRVEGSSTVPKIIPPKSTPPPPAALQRPIRQARLNVAANAASCSAVTKKVSAAEAKSQRAHSADPTPTTPEVSRNEPTLVTPTTNAGVATKSAATRELNSNDRDEWETVTRKRSAKQRRIVTGSGTTDDNLQTVERVKYVQAWSFRPETTVQNVVSHLNKIAQCDDYTVEKRELKTDRHAAFIIGFPESLYDLMTAPTSWPPRVKLSDWFLSRPRVSRGSPAARLSSYDPQHRPQV